eukprot:TRINITY_DN9054_c0_g1_i2.p1 TRINITY_DN9054_c0_g1~~TRINITY_DN9054_c0_g1_i2.p1  ORF type:complete len:204 (+),score=13.43 TRINITY_DN9054_c0_g1_i2:80-691(+)
MLETSLFFKGLSWQRAEEALSAPTYRDAEQDIIDSVNANRRVATQALVILRGAAGILMGATVAFFDVTVLNPISILESVYASGVSATPLFGYGLRQLVSFERLAVSTAKHPFAVGRIQFAGAAARRSYLRNHKCSYQPTIPLHPAVVVKADCSAQPSGRFRCWLAGMLPIAMCPSIWHFTEHNSKRSASDHTIRLDVSAIMVG